MKGKFLQDSHTLLVENRLEEFEYKLIKYFLFYFGKLLPLHHLYLDWLVVKLRPIRKQQIPHLFLNTDYIESKIEGDRKNFVMLLQFLTYAQHLPFETEYLGSTAYRQVGFSIDHFLKFQNPTVKSTNYYQLKKARQFLDELQNGIFITSFSRYEFQRLVLVPKVKIIKSKKLKSWIARVWLVEELFYYRYPFLLLDFFKQKITKDQFEVIKVFSSVDIEKEFFIKKFLDSYPSVISNQRIANIKRYFIELVKVLQEYDLIESNYKIMSDGYYHSVQ
jgi:hypothetical protein